MGRVLSKHLIFGVLMAISLCGAAMAQGYDAALVVTACGNQSYTSNDVRAVTQDTTGKECVNATVSATATISGFTPSGSYMNLTAATTTSEVGLPSGSLVIVSNVGSQDAFVNLGTSAAVTAALNNLPLPAKTSVALTVGSFTNIAAITAQGSSTIVVTGGSGLPTGWGSGVPVVGATSTSISGTVATGNTFQQVSAASATRRGCSIQNPSTASEVLYIFVGSTGGATINGSYSLAAGQSFNCAAGAGIVITDALQVTAPTAAHVFVGNVQ